MPDFCPGFGRANKAQPGGMGVGIGVGLDADDIAIAQNQLTALGAIVELNALDTSSMTPEQIALLSKNTVISMNPGAGTFYTQTDTTKIILNYYAP